MILVRQFLPRRWLVDEALQDRGAVRVHRPLHDYRQARQVAAAAGARAGVDAAIGGPV